MLHPKGNDGVSQKTIGRATGIPTRKQSVPHYEVFQEEKKKPKPKISDQITEHFRLNRFKGISQTEAISGPV